MGIKHLNGIPSPDYIRTEFKTITKLAFTFDDGVKLVIKGSTPDILADFYLYQGVDVNTKSEDSAPATALWFKNRGCHVYLTVDERVRNWLWWLVCRYRACKLNLKLLCE